MPRNSYLHAHKAPLGEAPLVFAFHGTGGDERQFFGLIEQILPHAGIVAPRGDVSEYGANRFFRRTAEGVYDMGDLAKRSTKMGAFIRAHKAAHPSVPIYGLGYSNGANILAAVLFDAPDLFDRAVLMHPLIPWAPAPQPGLNGRRVLITAGTRDPICPLPQTKQLAQYFRTQGSTVELSLNAGGHDVSQPEVATIAQFLQAS